ncbi:TniQ family protein [Propionivibrio sp.]|uniref:TniQ family protein n=1 Tax=Propionivibrio sp. TaxID=2212460 RepID=UPI003BEFB45C
MHLPLLVIPPGGINVVALPRLATPLFAPYETVWSWAAKLAAANALSAVEVSALLGILAATNYSLLPKRVPRAAQTMGKSLGFPPHQIESAFIDGALKSLRPLVCEQLRLCPACVREGHHFILHQLRSFACCPLHGLRLREHCLHCGEPLVYALGNSIVFGPINCLACRAPQLPVSRGGYPKTSAMSGRTLALIARWLAFLQRRVSQSIFFEADGVVDADKVGAARRERMQVFIPPKSANNPISLFCHGRWSVGSRYKCLEMCFWACANQLWRQCQQQSRRWYRQFLKGYPVESAPAPQILAFLYWRMTWQGCSNPYLLRRGHGLPLYGIAEWEAEQSVSDVDDFDAEMIEFANALEASWNEWLDCIDLLGVTELDRHVWRLRARPIAFISRPTERKKTHINNFV